MSTESVTNPAESTPDSAQDHREESSGSRFFRNFRQFIRFGLVGGSGVLVNFFIVFLCEKLSPLFDIHHEDIAFNLFGTQFNVRWYHIFVTIAFLGANLWNFELNRHWTFKSSSKGNWWKQFFSFLLVGLVAFVVSFAITTALMNLNSPISLPRDVFDGSTGLRNPLYWANAIGVLCAMPVNFLVNKLWTFRSHGNESSSDSQK